MFFVLTLFTGCASTDKSQTGGATSKKITYTYNAENDTFTFTVEKDYTGIIYISVASAILAIIVGFIVFLYVRNIIASKKNKFNSAIE